MAEVALALGADPWSAYFPVQLATSGPTWHLTDWAEVDTSGIKLAGAEIVQGLSTL